MRFPNKYQQIINRLGFEPVDEPVQLSNIELDNFETEIGHQLPRDYRQFLSSFGLMIGIGVGFPTKDRPNESVGGLEVFLLSSTDYR